MITVEHIGQQSEILRVAAVQEYNECCQKVVTLQRQLKEVNAALDTAIADLNTARGKCIALSMVQETINEALK